MYLVAYTTRRPGEGSFDHYVVVETMAEAENDYEVLTNHEHTARATICAVIKSTAYAPTLTTNLDILDRSNAL